MTIHELAFQVPDMLQTALHHKRLIFTVATGQDDTNFLTRTLSRLPNIVCQHEATPSFALAMEHGLDADAAYDFWLNHKLPRIAECPSPIYIETSHLFGNGFLEPLVRLGIVPDLIIVSHPLRDAAAHLYHAGLIPGRTRSGCTHLLTPDDADVLPLLGWQELHDYQLCYWYALEMARRSQKYATLCRSMGGRVATTTLAELETLAGFRRLVSALELPWIGLQQWLRFAWGMRPPAHQAAMAVAKLPKRVERLEQEVMERLGRWSFSA